MLVKALGYQPSITRRSFEHDCFTICWDLRRMPQDVTSAVSSRNGDLIRCELSNLGAGPAGAAKECWMTLISFDVFAIRESGCTLLS